MKKARLFEFRVESGRSRRMVNEIAQEIVAFGPIAATRANEAVVAESVENAIAELTYAIFGKNWHAEPPLNRRLEELRVHMAASIG